MMAENRLLNTIFHGEFGYFIYGGFVAPAAWFMACYVPETKGIKLEDMEKKQIMGRPFK